MKILNRDFLDAIREKRARLNLGAGRFPKPGFFSLDYADLPGIDIQADLNAPFSLIPDDSVVELYSRHSFEHVENFLGLMREIHRIMVPGGNMEVIVPHFSNSYGYSDPTHVRFFGLFTFYYFCSEVDQPAIRKVPSFYSDVRFRVESVRIDFYTNTFF